MDTSEKGVWAPQPASSGAANAAGNKAAAPAVVIVVSDDDGHGSGGGGGGATAVATPASPGTVASAFALVPAALAAPVAVSKPAPAAAAAPVAFAAGVATPTRPMYNPRSSSMMMGAPAVPRAMHGGLDGSNQRLRELLAWRNYTNRMTAGNGVAASATQQITHAAQMAIQAIHEAALLAAPGQQQARPPSAAAVVSATSPAAAPVVAATKPAQQAAPAATVVLPGEFDVPGLASKARKNVDGVSRLVVSAEFGTTSFKHIRHYANFMSVDMHFPDYTKNPSLSLVEGEYVHVFIGDTDPVITEEARLASTPHMPMCKDPRESRETVAIGRVVRRHEAGALIDILGAGDKKDDVRKVVPLTRVTRAGPVRIRDQVLRYDVKSKTWLDAIVEDREELNFVQRTSHDVRKDGYALPSFNVADLIHGWFIYTVKDQRSGIVHYNVPQELIFPARRILTAEVWDEEVNLAKMAGSKSSTSSSTSEVVPGSKFKKGDIVWLTKPGLVVAEYGSIEYFTAFNMHKGTKNHPNAVVVEILKVVGDSDVIPKHGVITGDCEEMGKVVDEIEGRRDKRIYYSAKVHAFTSQDVECIIFPWVPESALETPSVPAEQSDGVWWMDCFGRGVGRVTSTNKSKCPADKGKTTCAFTWRAIDGSIVVIQKFPTEYFIPSTYYKRADGSRNGTFLTINQLHDPTQSAKKVEPFSPHAPREYFFILNNFNVFNNWQPKTVSEKSLQEKTRAQMGYPLMTCVVRQYHNLEGERLVDLAFVRLSTYMQKKQIANAKKGKGENPLAGTVYEWMPESRALIARGVVWKELVSSSLMHEPMRKPALPVGTLAMMGNDYQDGTWQLVIIEESFSSSISVVKKVMPAVRLAQSDEIAEKMGFERTQWKTVEDFDEFAEDIRSGCVNSAQAVSFEQLIDKFLFSLVVRSCRSQSLNHVRAQNTTLIPLHLMPEEHKLKIGGKVDLSKLQVRHVDKDCYPLVRDKADGRLVLHGIEGIPPELQGGRVANIGRITKGRVRVVSCSLGTYPDSKTPGNGSSAWDREVYYDVNLNPWMNDGDLGCIKRVSSKYLWWGVARAEIGDIVFVRDRRDDVLRLAIVTGVEIGQDDSNIPDRKYTVWFLVLCDEGCLIPFHHAKSKETAVGASKMDVAAPDAGPVKRKVGPCITYPLPAVKRARNDRRQPLSKKLNQQRGTIDELGDRITDEEQKAEYDRLKAMLGPVLDEKKTVPGDEEKKIKDECTMVTQNAQYIWGFPIDADDTRWNWIRELLSIRTTYSMVLIPKAMERMSELAFKEQPNRWIIADMQVHGCEIIAGDDDLVPPYLKGLEKDLPFVPDTARILGDFFPHALPYGKSSPIYQACIEHQRVRRAANGKDD